MQNLEGEYFNFGKRGGAMALSLSAKLKPTPVQKKYLSMGKEQPGGKLPLFDNNGQRIGERTIAACMKAGWCEPWARNPIEPKWLVCKLTKDGYNILN